MDAAITLASALQGLREARGLTTYGLARTTGIPRTVLDRIEVNADVAKFGQLRTLANFYGFAEVSDLVAVAERRAIQLAESGKSAA